MRYFVIILLNFVVDSSIYIYCTYNGISYYYIKSEKLVFMDDSKYALIKIGNEMYGDIPKIKSIPLTQ